MEKYLEHSLRYFYTDSILLIVSFLTTIICILLRKRFIELSILPLYPLVCFLQLLSYSIYYFLSPENQNLVIPYFDYTIFIFLATEFYTLLLVFYKSIYSNPLRIFLKILFVIYTFYLSLTLIKNIEPQETFYLTQAVFVIIPAIIYIINIFQSDPKENLLNEPQFWITIGVLLYFLSTIPLYLAKKFIFSSDGDVIEPTVYSINLICYSIFFLFIIRAYLCKQKEI